MTSWNAGYPVPSAETPVGRALPPPVIASFCDCCVQITPATTAMIATTTTTVATTILFAPGAL